MIREWASTYRLTGRLRQLGFIGAAGVQLLGKIAAMFFSVVSVAIVSRSLGPVGYGEFAYAVSVVGLLAPLALMGTDLSAVRLMVRRERPEGELLAASLCIRVVCAAACVALLAAAAWFFARSYSEAWTVTLYSPILLVTALNVSTIVFQAKRRFHILAGMMVFQNALNLGLVALLASGKASVALFLLATVVSGCATMLLGWFFAMPGLDGRVKPSISTIKQMVGMSAPLGLSALLVTAYFKIDMALLGSMAAPDQLGNYAAAYKFLEVALFVSSAMMVPVYPILARAAEPGSNESRSIMAALSRCLLCAGAAIAGTLFLLADWLVAAVFGPSYSSAPNILRVLAVEVLLSYTATMMDVHLIALNRPHLRLRIAVVNLVANVVFNLLLIPTLGAMGAAAATLATEMCSIIQLSLLPNRAFPRGLPWSVLARAVGALLLLVAGATAAMPVLGIGAYVFGLALFATSAWHFGLLQKCDLQRLRM